MRPAGLATTYEDESPGDLKVLDGQMVDEKAQDGGDDQRGDDLAGAEGVEDQRRIGRRLLRDPLDHVGGGGVGRTDGAGRDGVRMWLMVKERAGEERKALGLVEAPARHSPMGPG
jgi:hypothetical protein